MLIKNKKPLPRTVRYYEEEPESFATKIAKFPIFVVIALVLVAIIVCTMFFINYNNNVLKMFVDASSQNFDCGGFEYSVTAGINEQTYMDFSGQIEFDLDGQKIQSVYHAAYEDYEYDAVVYGEGATAYRGNYYGGKWSVSSYTDRALDFFDFYRDYRKGDFDAGAMVRFTENNSKFNAEQLQISVEGMIKEFTKSSTLNNVLHAQTITDENGTTIKFTPEMDKVLDIYLEYIGSAYTSANAYSEFKSTIESSKQNFKDTVVVITYTISNEGYLTDITLDYTVNGDAYVIDISMSNFAQTEIEIDDGFFVAAGI